MYNKTIQTEKIINDILGMSKSFDWKIKDLFIKDNCIFANMDKTNIQGKSLGLFEEGLYCGSDIDSSDVFNVFEGLLETFNIRANVAKKLKDKNSYEVTTLIQTVKYSVSKSELISEFKKDFSKIYTMFLDNKENSPIETIEIALEQLRIKAIEDSAMNNSYEVVKLEITTVLDNTWLYWHDIKDIKIKKAFN